MPRKKKEKIKYFCRRCNNEIMTVDNVIHGGLCTSCFIELSTASRDERKKWYRSSQQEVGCL